MADISFTDKNKIAEIINTSNRLKYIILFTYKISLEDIISVRVDGDNFKVDVNTETEMFRFKAKGLDSVIIKDVETGILQLTFDPALAQGIYN
ncbi:MAG: hypothetical protein EAZ77_02955, partial [Nostocales cyanobacterium]